MHGTLNVMKSQSQDMYVYLLVRNYGLMKPLVSQLSSNTSQTTMLVTNPTNQLVLKAFHDSQKATLVAEFQDYLHVAGLNVPAIVRTTDKKLYLENGTSSMVLMEYVEGHGIGWTDDTQTLGNALVTSIARTVAMMHQAALAFKFSVLPKGLVLMPHGIATEGLDDTDLRTAFIHADFTRENIIVTPSYDAVASVIDFGDTMYGYLAYDLAVLLTQVFVTKTWGIDIHGIEMFMEEYSKLNPLSSAEQKVLVNFMLHKNHSLIDEIDHIDDKTAEAKNRTQSIKRSAQAKIELILNSELQLRSIIQKY